MVCTLLSITSPTMQCVALYRCKNECMCESTADSDDAKSQLVSAPNSQWIAGIITIMVSGNGLHLYSTFLVF